MANLLEASSWEAGIYQIEQTDPVLGGPPNINTGEGITNVPIMQLANRTVYLFDAIAILDVGFSAVYARTITAGNGLTGGGDLSANRTIAADIASQNEAEAGLISTKLMTPLRTAQAITQAIDALVAGAPGALDTLAELATQLTGNDDAIAALIVSIGAKLDASAYTAADILAKLLTVDGPASGLNADKLHGKEASAFVETTRSLITGAGLTGGGNLSANRTIAADVATQIEAEAGLISSKLMTPLRTAQAIVNAINAQVPLLLASQSYGAVGTYINGMVQTTGFAGGATFAGSSIRPSVNGTIQSSLPDDTRGSANSSAVWSGSGALSGTWRAMGGSQANNTTTYVRTTLFLRIA